MCYSLFCIFGGYTRGMASAPKPKLASNLNGTSGLGSKSSSGNQIKSLPNAPKAESAPNDAPKVDPSDDTIGPYGKVVDIGGDCYFL